MFITETDLRKFMHADLRTLYENCYKTEDLLPVYTDILLPSQERPQPAGSVFRRDLVKGMMGLDESNAAAFFAAMNPKWRAALEWLVWQGDVSLSDLEKELNFEMAAMHTEVGYRHAPDVETLTFHQPYHLILFQERYGRYWRQTAKESCRVMLPPALRTQLRKLLPKPTGYDLEPVESIPETVRRYRCDETLADDFYIAADYIQQGHLQYTKNENIGRKSVRGVSELTMSGEFFPGEKSSNKLPLLRHELLLNILASAGQSLRDAMLANEPDPDLILRGFLKKLFSRPDWIHEYALTHVRPLGAPSEYDKWVMPQLRDLLKKFSESEWILATNLQSYVSYRELDFNFLPTERLQVRIDSESPSYDYSNTLAVDEQSRAELMDFPLVQSVLFLLAAIGMVEVAYEVPRQHPHWQRPSEKFLTPFDGLYAARLTPLGSYALGLTDEVTFEARARKKAELILNPARLTATCRNIDPVTEMTLLEFMEKVSPGCYRMTRKQMIKNCASESDIQLRVEQFAAFLPVELPPLWQTFLNELADSALALHKECSYEVYQLTNTPELRRLFSEDPVLREKTLKVEGYRVAIRVADQPTVARRLKSLGFMMR